MSTKPDYSDTTTRVDAWRATWNIRAYQFFGISSVMTLWDEMRRIKETDISANSVIYDAWKYANSGDFYNFYKALIDDDSEFKAESPVVIREMYVNAYGEEAKKITGILEKRGDKQVFYKTHHEYELIELTVNLNYSRGETPVAEIPQPDPGGTNNCVFIH